VNCSVDPLKGVEIVTPAVSHKKTQFLFAK